MFEKNLKAIRQNNPELAGRLEKIDIADIKDIVVEEAETGDLIIGYKNVALHSMADPIREAKVIWNKAINFDLRKNDFQIVFGLGLGYLFKRAYISANSKIILVEPFLEVLRFVLEHVDLSAELSDKRVLVTDNVKDVADKLNAEYLQGDRAEFLCIPAYTTLAPSIAEELTSEIIQVMTEKQTDINTIFLRSLPWAQNFILNLPYFPDMRPIGYLKNTFEGKTALILAAGPGLAENIEKIKQNRNKYVLFAVNKTIEYLAKNDLTPDFVVFADTRTYVLNSSQVEESTKNFLKNTNIIMMPRTDNTFAMYGAKKKLLYITETEAFREFANTASDNELGVGKSAGSVAILSYFIAKELGFRTIAFSGLDLAFPDNKMYTDGQELVTNEQGYIQYKDEKLAGMRKKPAFTKDINGNDILTRDDYLVFIRQFEEILEEETSLIKVINTSLKGAFIKGMEYLDFDSFIRNIDVQNVNMDELLSVTFEKTSEKWMNIINDMRPKVLEKHQDFLELHKSAISVIEEIDSVIIALEQSADNAHDMFNSLNEKLVKLRGKAMQDKLIQNVLQGTFWQYAKNYKTENILNIETVIENLKTEKTLFDDIRYKMSGLVKSVEIAAEKIKTEQVSL